MKYQENKTMGTVNIKSGHSELNIDSSGIKLFDSDRDTIQIDSDGVVIRSNQNIDRVKHENLSKRICIDKKCISKHSDKNDTRCYMLDNIESDINCDEVKKYFEQFNIYIK